MAVMENLQLVLCVSIPFCAVSLRISGSWHYTDPGPSGYMLDVFEEGIPERFIGQFADPHPRSTAKACGEGKKVSTRNEQICKKKFSLLTVSYSVSLIYIQDNNVQVL